MRRSFGGSDLAVARGHSDMAGSGNSAGSGAILGH